MERLFEISQERSCRLPGQSQGQLNLRLSFAVQYESDGTVKRLILPKLNCPEAEGVLASLDEETPAVLVQCRTSDEKER